MDMFLFRFKRYIRLNLFYILDDNNSLTDGFTLQIFFLIARKLHFVFNTKYGYYTPNFYIMQLHLIKSISKYSLRHFFL